LAKKYGILAFAALLLFSCNFSRPITPLTHDTSSQDTAAAQINSQKTTEKYSLTFLAAGDNLFHDTIINTHKQDDGHDFSGIYTEVKNLVQKADLAFINQETVMAGERFGHSGYPEFNSPQILAKNLADTGFDIINHANNHAMDRGKNGMIATLDLWETMPEITVIGVRKSGESHKIITKNNITLGFLSYTYGLNGIPLPEDSPNLVSLIDEKTMSEEAAALRPLCDFMIVSIHWGEEYKTEPSEEQKDIALLLARHNTDLIIGHHPHVLQPVESLPRADGKEMLCFYSIGNFVSNQRNKERLLGAMMLVTFIKEIPDGDNAELIIADSGLIPVICHFERDFSGTKVYPLYSYTNELLEKHRQSFIDKEMTLEYYNGVMNSLGTKIYTDNPFNMEE